MLVVDDNLIQTTLQVALEQHLLDSEDTLAIFLDRAVIDDRLHRLREAFGESAHHAVAIKSNPLMHVLQHLVRQGAGLEAASFAEVCMASSAGIDNTRIVFDSPAKTVREIQQLQERFPGIRVNADSLTELSRYPQSGSGLKIGLRVNPLITASTVESMNVGGKKSKFGESIDNHESIVREAVRCEDLDCLHIHVGSQYTDLEPTVLAVRRIVDLAHDINKAAKENKITTIDIGGGFPVNYHSGKPYHIKDYALALKSKCPELFDGQFEIITEFGRYVHANACWALSRVEYTKPSNLIVHAGADMFVRECYNPDDWHHEMMVLDSNGEPKAGQSVPVDIAGPLCFGGDFIGRGVEIPAAKSGDWLAIKDVGANTFSLWSRHCSRAFPKVLATDSNLDAIAVEIVKRRESIESIVKFWS